ncbi:MAG: sensor histidine kinase, partial [Bryobacteraceae bacterium]
LGHAAGVMIFAIFLYLIVRQQSVVRLRAKTLPLVAGVLALLWNLASLMVLVMGSGDRMPERIVAAVGFSVLSILPAVLLQVCLHGRDPWIVRTSYALGGFAVFAHVQELIRDDPAWHRIGLGAISIGFGALTTLAVIKGFWSGKGGSRPLTSRLLATMSLFLFATSFVHFGEGHPVQAWSSELAIHHAGIPLALFVLLQDFRFVLLDAFARFVATGLLAGLFGLAIAAVLPGLSFPLQALTAAGALAAFALCRGIVQRFLTRIIFRQPDPERTAQALRALRSQCSGEEEYLRRAMETAAGLMKASLIDLAAQPDGAANLIRPAPVMELPEHRDLLHRGAQVVVPLRLTHGDFRLALLGERQGGQPYLSEDLEVLARMSACIAGEVEQIREAEIQQLVAQAELRALQSQIHPHFLFNALNTLYGVIPREAAGARRMLLNLADIFRYFLQSERTFVPLEDEMRIVEAYLSIESLRLGEKLKTELDVDPAALREPIPVLSIQPLVENAVKHGAAARPEGGLVRLEVALDDRGLRVAVSDTGPGFARAAGETSRGAGVALDNVTRRLRLCYGPEAEVSIESGPAGSRVSFLAPTGRPVAG